MVSQPLLNVLFITYNHVLYVAEALDSVLSQKTNFDFKVVIGDDCSTDGTREVVLQYAEKYPDKIILSNPIKNIGPSRNYIQLFEKCSNSKYMAYLEGDDYWTDTNKLQKQVDFMEVNPDYTICFHNVDLLSLDELGNKHFSTYNKVFKNDYSFDDLTLSNPIATGSCVFRNNVFNSNVFKNTEPYDDFFHLLYLEKGRARFINEKMAVYRLHSGGTWSSKSISEKYISHINIRKMILTYFYAFPAYKNNHLFYIPISDLYKNLAMCYYENKQKIPFLKAYITYLFFAKKGKQLTSYRDFLKLSYTILIR